MKKMLLSGVALLLMISLVISACSGNGSTGDNPTGDSSSTGDSSTGNTSESGSQTETASTPVEESNLTPPGTFPIVKEKVDLTIMTTADARVENFETNTFTLYLEELLNVDLHFEAIPPESVKDTLNLRLASGDYPDIILYMQVNKIQEAIYGQQGGFVALNDLIEEQGFYFKQLLEEKPEIRNAITTTDGNIYGVPSYSECYHCTMAMKMWINQSWLTQLGLSMPTTTDEFYNVLKAFKTEDPNGNGLADEIPIAGRVDVGGRHKIETFLMNSFVNAPFINPYPWMFLENGQVKAAFHEPGWREGLRYLHKLYAEGLIAGESFTQDATQLKAMGENPGVPILGAFPGLQVGSATQFGGESGRYKDFTWLPPLKGPSGVQYAAFDPYRSVLTGQLIITSNAKNPEVAFRFADAFFSDEVRQRSLGVEGVDWAPAEPGMLGTDGSPATRVRLAAYGDITNNHWYETTPGNASGAFRFGEYAGEDPDENLEVILYRATKDYEPYHTPIDAVMPPLYYSEEQVSELADLQKTIGDYVDQMTARFIIGDANIETEWDSYINTLDGMNFARYIEIHQSTVDATR